MGKTKLFTEPENNSNSGNPFFKRPPRQKHPISGRRPGSQADEIPVGVLLLQIQIRLRRWWIALRFQADRLTMGLFRGRTLVRVLTVAAGLYCVLETDIWTPAEQPPEEAYGKSILSEQTLESVGLSHPAPRPKPAQKPKKRPAAAPAPTPAALPIEKPDDQTSAYITRFRKIAQIEMEKYGVPASISLAQGLIESNAGASKLARANNNHFGIKCFQKNCRQGHCTNHSDDSHKDFFRKFSSAWESWRAHSIMISTGRYAKLKKHGKNYKKWAAGLKEIGYATDRNYDEKLIGMIERYGLHRYDQ
jgi:flagellum-specific peptidoglycan hydrolase FlgJ